MKKGSGVYRVLVGRPEGKRPLKRPRHRWEDKLKLEIRIDGANWIRLAQVRCNGGLCEHDNEPSGSINKAGYILTG
jgi:hypothetical protein